MENVIKICEPPYIPVSWGELIDKITILEIKNKRLKSLEAIRNVQIELAALQVHEYKILSSQIQTLKIALTVVNSKLWDIEEDIRNLESQKIFDEKFIELARSVYINNDERARLKRAINLLTKSSLMEEKSYN